jgi:hypothetical protein
MRLFALPTVRPFLGFVEHLWGNTLGKPPKSASFLVDLGGHNKNRSGVIAGPVITLDHG